MSRVRFSGGAGVLVRGAIYASVVGEGARALCTGGRSGGCALFDDWLGEDEEGQ